MKLSITIALVTGLAAATPAFAFGGPWGRPTFGDLDTDGNGVISSEEFVAPAVDRFNKLDTDGDGVLSSAEFTAPLAEHFKEIDTNGDGVLTQDELQAAHSRHHHHDDD
jgi:Ca2+-binding EF-hand superfamily protein